MSTVLSLTDGYLTLSTMSVVDLLDGDLKAKVETYMVPSDNLTLETSIGQGEMGSGLFFCRSCLSPDFRLTAIQLLD